ncbi:PREDICTED: sialic acid-binding Ig-like lectin 5 [Myotis brandtii]|uniref:sialic acid-binding Ig-like lectin 5 n=1 Tax=Myotis brandtii TaxID=109478 RepID=UPI0007044B2C|nr:PREDICTED: sialic acid-binding Ig-like lectin 5 [Myotis brandtii]
MVPLLLLPLLWEGSLQQQPGYQYELRVQDSVIVHEGLCVHVPCSFFYPWSSWSSPRNLYTYWYRDRDNTDCDVPVASSNPRKPVKSETENRFIFADPKTKDCSLYIRYARRSDTGRYFFQVEIGNSVKHSYREKMLNLQVTDKPHIQILEPLESWHHTELTCILPGSCERGQPLTFSWAGAAVDSLDPQTLGSSVLTFTPRPRDHGSNLTCQVKREWPHLTSQRTIRLNVSYAPGNLTIGVSFRNDPDFKNLQTAFLTILEGEALRLRCVADSNPPAELSWFRGSPGLNATPISSTAILELPRVGPAQEGEFTCQARHPLGSHSVSLSLSVVYPPQLLGPSCSWEDQGLHCSCSSRAQPAPSLRWRLGAGLLEGNHGNASRKAVPQAGVVPVALGGAGALALLSLCLCLLSFCRVKARRRQAAGRTKVTNDEDPVMGTVTWDFGLLSPHCLSSPRLHFCLPPHDAAELSSDSQPLRLCFLAASLAFRPLLQNKLPFALRFWLLFDVFK